MKVRDMMMSAPKHCRPDTNLASAVETMWTNDCGFLPVVDEDGRVAGVITDRDICIALVMFRRYFISNSISYNFWEDSEVNCNWAKV